MRTSIRALALASALTLAGVSACSSPTDAPSGGDADPAETQPVDSDTDGDGDDADDGSGGDDDADDDGGYAFGVDREAIAEAISAAFASRNGVATWSGDTLVLKIDGDAESPVDPFSDCRVLEQLLTEGDDAVVEYPNGRVECD